MRLRVARKVMYGKRETHGVTGLPTWRELTLDRSLARLRKVRRLRRRQAIERGLHAGECMEGGIGR